MQTILKIAFQFFHCVFYCHYLGYQHRLFSLEHSIQVSPTKTGSEVANSHTVRVGHGDDFKDNLLPQLYRDLILRDQELQESLDSIASACLSRMYSGADKHASLEGVWDIRVSDGEQRDIEPC